MILQKNNEATKTATEGVSLQPKKFIMKCKNYSQTGHNIRTCESPMMTADPKKADDPKEAETRAGPSNNSAKFTSRKRILKVRKTIAKQ